MSLCGVLFFLLAYGLLSLGWLIGWLCRGMWQPE